MDRVAEMVQEALRRPQNIDKKYGFNKDYYKASKQVYTFKINLVIIKFYK